MKTALPLVLCTRGQTGNVCPGTPEPVAWRTKAVVPSTTTCGAAAPQTLKIYQAFGRRLMIPGASGATSLANPGQPLLRPKSGQSSQRRTVARLPNRTIKERREVRRHHDQAVERESLEILADFRATICSPSVIRDQA